MTELALDDTKLVFNFGADAGLNLLQRLLERDDRLALVHGLALPRHDVNVPVRLGVLGLHFFTLVNTPVAQVGKNGFPEFDTKRAKCLLLLETATKFSLQQAQLGIWHGLSELCCHKQFDLLATNLWVPVTAPPKLMNIA